jgi:hypothetical protein
MLRGPIGLEAAPLLKSYVRAKALGKGANERDRRLKRPSLGRISRPIVVTACMASSSESWDPYRRLHLLYSRAGGGAAHCIKSGLTHRSNRAFFLRLNDRGGQVR